ncbi:prostaglandin reductase 3 [Lampetra planeri]
MLGPGAPRLVTLLLPPRRLLRLPSRGIIDMSYTQHFVEGGRPLPRSHSKLVVTALSTDFREAVQLQEAPVPSPDSDQVLVRNRFVGINASDINFSAGRYNPRVRPPFDAGLEAVGTVVARGLAASARFSLGQPVAYAAEGAFAEYKVVPAASIFPLPELKAEYLTLPVSALTALLSLERSAELRAGESVLVTAAAGGTGQFAVQLAARAGCRVLGTCSSDEKAAFLATLGCHRPINVRKESLAKVLKEECPKGVNVVYESVGGDTFETAVNSLAVCGRLIIIGYIEGYRAEAGSAGGDKKTKSARVLPSVQAHLLVKSASVRGFFLPHFVAEHGAGVERLAGMVRRGELLAAVDGGAATDGGPFRGLGDVHRAVEHLYSRRSLGKVVVELPDSPAAKL